VTSRREGKKKTYDTPVSSFSLQEWHEDVVQMGSSRTAPRWAELISFSCVPPFFFFFLLDWCEGVRRCASIVPV